VYNFYLLIFTIVIFFFPYCYYRVQWIFLLLVGNRKGIWPQKSAPITPYRMYFPFTSLRPTKPNLLHPRSQGVVLHKQYASLHRLMEDLHKGKKVCHLYSASSELLHFWSAQHGSHSFLHCKYTMPPLPRSSPGGATTEWTVIAPANEAYFSFIDPVRMKGWVGLVGWPTADGIPI